MTASELKASVSNRTARCVEVVLEGRLEEGSVELLANVVEAAVEVGKPIIRLDLSGVTFIDMCGLDALLDANWSARRAGSALELVAPWRVMDMLALTGTDGLFHLARYASRPAEEGPLPLTG